MLELEQKGQPYVKKRYNEKLRQNVLKNRSVSSVEYRMQNISYVLEKLGQPRIKGYMPAGNVGKKTEEKIQNILKHHIPTSNSEELELSVKFHIDNPIPIRPTGNEAPNKSQRSIDVFGRCSKVKAWVIKRANGICECCKQFAPFVNTEGMPFLEVHHILPLAEGGKDKIENTVAVCPRPFLI